MIWFLVKSTLNPHLPYYRYTLLSVCGVYILRILIKKKILSNSPVPLVKAGKNTTAMR